MNSSFRFPKRAHIEMSSRCNLKCVTCKHGYVDYGTDMDTELCNFLVNSIIPHLDEIELQGTGEAILNPAFFHVFKAASKNPHCRIVLITNATLLNERIASDFVASNMQLVFSLDGPDEITFQKMRPVGSFQKIINNICLIKDKRMEKCNPQFSTVINMVLTAENLSTVKKMIDLSLECGIDYLFVSEVRQCMPDDNQWERLRLNKTEMRPLLDSIISEAKAYACEKNLGFSFNPYSLDHKARKWICPSPWQHIFISSKGDLSFCCELNRFFGNIKLNRFDEVWNGKLANEFRNNMLMGNYHQNCRTCCLPWGLTNE